MARERRARAFGTRVRADCALEGSGAFAEAPAMTHATPEAVGTFRWAVHGRSSLTEEVLFSEGFDVEERERARESTDAIPGLLNEVVIEHVLKPDHLLAASDLARLRAVSPAMRNAVDATGRDLRSDEQKRQAHRRAIMKFCKAERPKILAANPQLTFCGVTRELSIRWRAMSDAQKAKYK